jgi:predicted regulator of Ras-like GTPase activity (Roadblock/LC7/MglB family)
VTQAALTDRQLDWLVNDLVRRVPAVAHALVVSAEGLALAVSELVDGARADQLAAAASGLASLTRSAARCLGAEPATQTIVEMTGGYLFVTAVGEDASLAAVADTRCEMGAVGYEMSRLAGRIAQLLAVAARPAPEPAIPPGPTA